MLPLHWIVLNSLQVGALLALAASFGADALHRRDRMMALLTLGCLLVATRHGATVLALAKALEPDLADRLQSGLASLGFLSMIASLTVAMPGRFHRRFIPVLALGILPNLARVFLLPMDGVLGVQLHRVTLLAYLAACVTAIVVVGRARLAGDPLASRIFGGLVLTALPAMVEASALLGLGLKVSVTGLSIILLAITLGVSWLWVMTHDLQGQLEGAQQEAATWRRLLPGLTWRSGEGARGLDRLLGAGWEQRAGENVTGGDGRSYRLHRVDMATGESLAWLEPESGAPRSGDTFLKGWHVGLGMDEERDGDEVRTWLERWGAEVELWGTVPPREGPYPSLLIWAREPSILAVWREDDLARRRPRWIQVGGAEIEGPHARLERPCVEGDLRRALQGLLNFGR